MVSRGVIALAFVVLAATSARAGELDAAMGKALFERNWVAAPSSTGSDDGLGPLYDARSCAACHAGGAPGRVAPFAVGAGMVVRLGNARGVGDPIYGTQLQTSALPGLRPEGTATFAIMQDGLRRFIVQLRKLEYGPMAPATHAGLRRAPPLRGIGLLASIPQKEIVAHADAADRNNDGISGRVGVGRFGWKATQPALATQIEIAMSRDIGLSTTGHPAPWGDCTRAEAQCRAGPHGAAPGQVEVPDTLRNMIVAYLVSLPPPAPLKTNSRGFAVFNAIGCALCHANPRGADGKPVPAYSDLLLHDMGRRLDDGIVEGDARASEWRTAPLWDVAEEVAQGGLMHDGRAPNVTEAIAFHGGEAARSRARFNALSPPDKAALIAFLMGK